MQFAQRTQIFGWSACVIKRIVSPITVGILIRFVLVISLFPIIHRDLFLPFISYSLNNPSVDIWQSWLDSGGRQDAFPYGLAMLIPIATFVMISELLTPVNLSASSISLGLLVVFYELAVLKLLSKRTTLNSTAVWIYALSPLGIYISFIHGQIDVIPTLYLLMMFVFLDKQRWTAAGIFLGLAVSAKLSFLLFLPVAIVFFVDNPRYKRGLIKMAKSFIFSMLILQLPVMTLSGYREMVLATPEANRVLTYGIVLAEDFRFLIFPSVYVLLLYWLWRVGRSTTTVLLTFTGASFLGVALAAPGAIGWYLWSLPILALLSNQKNKSFIFLNLIVQILVLLTFWGQQTGSVSRFGESSFDLTLEIQISQIKQILETLLLVFGGLLIVSILRGAIKDGDVFSIGTKPLSIAIAGDSGVGKDTLSESLTKIFGTHLTTYISGDDYHIYERGDKIWSGTTHLHPNANNLNLMQTDLEKALNRESVRSRHYDHSAGRFTKPFVQKPSDLVLVNGLHALTLKSTKEKVDLKVYLSMDEDLRRQLKIERDVRTRGASAQSVLSSIETRVPDFKAYIEPQEGLADLSLMLVPLASPFNDLNQRNFKVQCVLRDLYFAENLVRKLRSLSNVNVSHEVLREGLEKMEIDAYSLTSEDYSSLLEVMVEHKNQLFVDEPVFASGAKGLMSLLVLLGLVERRSRIRG
jgi:uridine kinase